MLFDLLKRAYLEAYFYNLKALLHTEAKQKILGLSVKFGVKSVKTVLYWENFLTNRRYLMGIA